MKNLIIVVSIAVLLSASTTLKKGKIKQSYPVVISQIDNIKHIQNPDFPRDGRFEFEMEEELTIGDSDKENYFFSHISNCLIDSKGNFIILDNTSKLGVSHVIKMYNNQGKYLRTVSREGKGPGEYLRGVSLFLLPDDRVGFSCNNLRITIFDKDFKKSEIYKTNKRFFKIQNLDNTSFYYLDDKMLNHKITSQEKEYPTYYSVSKYSFKEKKNSVITEFQSENINMSRDGEMVIAQSNFVPGFTFHKDILYIYPRKEYKLLKLDKTGKNLFSFGRDHKIIKAYNKKGEVRDENAQFIDEKIIIDESSNIWLRTLENEQKNKEKNIFKYDIFSPEGIYIKEAILQHPVHLFKFGKVYSITTNAEGFSVMKRLKVVKQTKK